LTKLLARHAEAIFWMARQVERMNNIARIIDVHEMFGRDVRGPQNWEAVLRIYADYDRFIAGGAQVTAEHVLYFYLMDPDNPGSVYANLKMARENARALRPHISTEMWVHINTFYNSMRGLKRRDIDEERVSLVCARIKEACQTHSGITAETLYQDESWYFSKLGMNIERADQTSRLLDARFGMLQTDADDPGSPADVAQWNALLRSAAGYHAFRRAHPSGLDAAKAAGFLLLDDRFPRSVVACVQEATDTLARLRQRYGFEGGADALASLEAFRTQLADERIEDIIEAGLHAYLDAVQLRMIEVSNALSRDFFAF